MPVHIDLNYGLFSPREHLAVHGPIDLFLSSHVLEHMPDLCTFLRELHSVMAPGGLVFTEVPFQPAARLKAYANGGAQGGLFHLSLPSQRSMDLLMLANGFRRVALTDTTVGISMGAIRALHVKV